MDIITYPLVWSIDNKSHSFIGITEDGARKEFILPLRKHKYDRHEWGTFNWFQGYVDDKNKFIITSIVKKEPPIIKSYKIIQHEKFLIEIEGLQTYKAESIEELEALIIKDLEKHQIDRLYIDLISVSFSYKLSKYFAGYYKRCWSQETIATYCNALSCTPYEVYFLRSIYPTCHKLNIKTNKENGQYNLGSKNLPAGEYRDVVSYNISNIYIDELSKSDDERYKKLADVLKIANIKHAYFFCFYIEFPQLILDNIKTRIDSLNPIWHRGFEIEVLNPIDDPCAKVYEKYDYIIQINKHHRITLYNDKVKSRGYLTSIPYIKDLLEIIIRNWYLGNKELPPIPNYFSICEVVKNRKVLGYMSDTLKELYIREKIPFNKSIPHIRLTSNCFWPTIFYNGSDPQSGQAIDVRYYQNCIEKFYQTLRPLM